MEDDYRKDLSKKIFKLIDVKKNSLDDVCYRKIKYALEVGNASIEEYDENIIVFDEEVGIYINENIVSNILLESTYGNDNIFTSIKLWYVIPVNDMEVMVLNNVLIRY